MKLFAIVDTHENASAMKKAEKTIAEERPDIIICAGDLSIFEQQLSKMVRWLASFKRPTFIVHGNHETASHLMRECEKYESIHFVHGQILEYKNGSKSSNNSLAIVGWGGGGFSNRDKLFEDFIKANKKEFAAKKNIIFITHAPPANTILDESYYDNNHYGCTSFTEFVKNNKNVALLVCGHFHENKGKQGLLGSATIINPGPSGMIVEL